MDMKVYTASSFAKSNWRVEWNNNGDGTYRRPNVGKLGVTNVPIPEHENIAQIYSMAFDYARDNYMTTGATYEKCLDLIKAKYGELTTEMTDYIYHCPWNAGQRAGLLIEDPHFYD